MPLAFVKIQKFFVIWSKFFVIHSFDKSTRQICFMRYSSYHSVIVNKVIKKTLVDDFLAKHLTDFLFGFNFLVSCHFFFSFPECIYIISSYIYFVNYLLDYCSLRRRRYFRISPHFPVLLQTKVNPKYDYNVSL